MLHPPLSPFNGCKSTLTPITLLSELSAGESLGRQKAAIQKAGGPFDGERARSTGMESEHVRQEVYQIIVKGHLDSEWSDWFDGLTITQVDSGETVLTGLVVDQAALHGVLIKIRDLGLTLMSLTRIETGR